MPLREFRDLADANRQLHDWVMQQAGTREHGTTREQPLLVRLLDVPPVLAVWWEVKVLPLGASSTRRYCTRCRPAITRRLERRGASGG